MESLGGGGHMNIAGAQLEDISIDDAKQIIKDTIDEMIDSGDIKL
jgi:c-di-AMP phosphodiesterase-like protein